MITFPTPNIAVALIRADEVKALYAYVVQDFGSHQSYAIILEDHEGKTYAMNEQTAFSGTTTLRDQLLVALNSINEQLDSGDAIAVMPCVLS